MVLVYLLTNILLEMHSTNQFSLVIRDSRMEKAILDCLNHKNVPNFLYDTFLHSLYVYLLGNISLME